MPTLESSPTRSDSNKLAKLSADVTAGSTLGSVGPFNGINTFGPKCMDQNSGAPISGSTF